MKKLTLAATSVVGVLIIGGGLWIARDNLFSSGGGSDFDQVVRTPGNGGVADAKTQAIVAAAQGFLARLSAEHYAQTVYAFEDAAQTGRWSNLPEGIVQRGGLKLGDMSDDQKIALNTLLEEVMSDDGMRNIVMQMAADDMLPSGGNLIFGSDYYYLSFLGEPADDTPWGLQFGGHHMAINVSVFGADVSFSPMLTGGQPMTVSFEGQEATLAEAETTAAQALLESLDPDQLAAAVRSDTAIDLVLGPGAHGTVIAPEGIKGSDLTESQKGLLQAVIAARLGFINDDDYAPKMATVMAELDATYFGWWGPQGTLGAAYFRVTGPSIVMEYAPQDMGGDPTEHAHNIYRNPANDYGLAWLGRD